jgi:hypothetical protein
MKIRNGFVSNSSSSSFYFGPQMTRNYPTPKPKLYLKKLNILKAMEQIRKKQFIHLKADSFYPYFSLENDMIYYHLDESKFEKYKIEEFVLEFQEEDFYVE